MNFLATWTIQPEHMLPAQKRFVEKGGQYGQGVHVSRPVALR